MAILLNSYFLDMWHLHNLKMQIILFRFDTYNLELLYIFTIAIVYIVANSYDIVIFSCYIIDHAILALYC
jgi:hypothetical protein